MKHLSAIVIIALLLSAVSVFAVGAAEQGDTGDGISTAESPTVTVGKTLYQALSGMNSLSQEDAAYFCALIAQSESENGWISDVTNSATVCIVSISETGKADEAAAYYYSATGGVFNDLDGMRSLKLTDGARDIVNAILSKYTELTPDDFIAAYWDSELPVDVLIRELSDTGCNVKLENAEPEFLRGRRYKLTINTAAEDVITIYEYPDSALAQEDAACVDEFGSAARYQDHVVYVTWKNVPHFYRKDNIIFQYIGTNRAVLDRLDFMCGAQFAGGSAD